MIRTFLKTVTDSKALLGIESLTATRVTDEKDKAIPCTLL